MALGSNPESEFCTLLEAHTDCLLNDRVLKKLIGGLQ